MKTKYKLDKDKKLSVNIIVELFFELSQLKNLYRQGWLKRKVSMAHCETDADHSFLLGILSYIIAIEHRPDLDPLRVMLLSIFHEIGEIDPGDVTPLDGISKEEKSKLELACVERIFKNFPNPEKYISIWKEFEYEKTPEAKFVRQMDKLEMALQARLYQKLGYSELGDFFPHVEERLEDPELQKIFSDLIE